MVEFREKPIHPLDAIGAGIFSESTFHKAEIDDLRRDLARRCLRLNGPCSGWRRKWCGLADVCELGIV